MGKADAMALVQGLNFLPTPVSAAHSPLYSNMGQAQVGQCSVLVDREVWCHHSGAAKGTGQIPRAEGVEQALPCERGQEFRQN